MHFVFFLRKLQVPCLFEREWTKDIMKGMWKVQLQFLMPSQRCVALVSQVSTTMYL